MPLYFQQNKIIIFTISNAIYSQITTEIYLTRSNWGISKSKNLRPISSNNSWPHPNKLTASLQPEPARPGRDGVEHPRLARPPRLLRRRPHRRQPLGGERADVDAEGGDARGEFGDLPERVDHGRRRAGGEEGVGHEVHGDEVGDALDEGWLGSDGGEVGPGCWTPLWGGLLVFYLVGVVYHGCLSNSDEEDLCIKTWICNGYGDRKHMITYICVHMPLYICILGWLPLELKKNDSSGLFCSK